MENITWWLHRQIPSVLAMTTPSKQHFDVASPDLRFVASGRDGEEHGCPECKNLAHGRKQAEVDRDRSRFADFNVLIARHQLTHAAKP